jgi:phosphatidylserine/phosphatidylglycerophosphate/cardiolipin synthase-like enzyme
MRTRVVGTEVKVRAIAGTHTVMLAMDATKQGRTGLLGFAIKRRDDPEGQEYWLSATKVFPSVVPQPVAGASHSTLAQPIQSFLWGDYSAKPGRTYEYTVRPLYGEPKNMVAGRDVRVTVTTELEQDEGHGVWFNRGAIASRAYAARFNNAAPEAPEEPSHPQTQWLSRGLLEACLRFIKTTRKGQALRVAAYEFTYAPILLALKDAIRRGVDVLVIYEAGPTSQQPGAAKTTSAKANENAIRRHGFPRAALIRRTRRSKIPHNKFLVRVSARGNALAVFTGSTNFTESGFLGQSNVGHLVTERSVAKAYLEYWNLLAEDPKSTEAAKDCMVLSPDPDDLPDGTTCIFSPRSKSRMLEWYGERIGEARNTIMFTAAFSVADEIAVPLSEDRDHLRFVLLEKPPTRKTAAYFAKDRDIVVAYGNVLGQQYLPNASGELTLRRDIPDFRLDEWFLEEEHYRKTGHVFFVHLKVLIVDPLSSSPLVCTGSANFSRPSLTSNDENMLLVKGDTRVADIYMCEFDRLLRHFYFRRMAAELHGDGDEATAVFLKEDDRWTRDYFARGRFKSKRRELLMYTG